MTAISSSMQSRDFGSLSRSERSRNRVSGVRRSWLIATSMCVRSSTSLRTRPRMSCNASATCLISRGPVRAQWRAIPGDWPKERAAERDRRQRRGDRPQRIEEKNERDADDYRHRANHLNENQIVQDRVGEASNASAVPSLSLTTRESLGSSLGTLGRDASPQFSSRSALTIRMYSESDRGASSIGSSDRAA